MELIIPVFTIIQNQNELFLRTILLSMRYTAAADDIFKMYILFKSVKIIKYYYYPISNQDVKCVQISTNMHSFSLARFLK